MYVTYSLTKVVNYEEISVSVVLITYFMSKKVLEIQQRLSVRKKDITEGRHCRGFNEKADGFNFVLSVALTLVFSV